MALFPGSRCSINRPDHTICGLDIQRAVGDVRLRRGTRRNTTSINFDVDTEIRMRIISSAVSGVRDRRGELLLSL